MGYQQDDKNWGEGGEKGQKESPNYEKRKKQVIFCSFPCFESKGEFFEDQNIKLKKPEGRRGRKERTKGRERERSRRESAPQKTSNINFFTGKRGKKKMVR